MFFKDMTIGSGCDSLCYYIRVRRQKKEEKGRKTESVLDNHYKKKDLIQRKKSLQ